MNGYQGVGGGGSPQQGTMELLGWWVCFLSRLPRWLRNYAFVTTHRKVYFTKGKSSCMEIISE